MKKMMSLIINFIIIILEIIGLVMGVNRSNKLGLEYYTIQSNILLLFSSSLYITYIIERKKAPKWMQLLKYTATASTTLTFFVVIFVLAPMIKFNYGYILLYNSLLYHHLLCPVLAIITFIFFDELNDYNFKDSLMAISVTFLYAFVLTILNILCVLEGPYPFLMVRKNSLLMSLIWYISILSMAYIICLILRKTKNRVSK